MHRDRKCDIGMELSSKRIHMDVSLATARQDSLQKLPPMRIMTADLEVTGE